MFLNEKNITDNDCSIISKNSINLNKIEPCNNLNKINEVEIEEREIIEKEELKAKKKYKSKKI